MRLVERVTKRVAYSPASTPVTDPRHKALARFFWKGTHTLAATTGTTPTFTRATSATFEDFEGLIKTAESSEPRFVGARRVENLLTASEDMTNAAYADQLGAVSAATQTVFDGTANGSVYQLVTITDDGSGVGGRTFVFSAEIALVSGTLTSGTDIRIQGNAMTAVTSDISSLITATPQRFSVTASTDAAGTNVEPIIRCDDAATLLITNWQLEEVTGQTNQNPSEYVSTGVATGPELVTNGDFSNGTTDWTALYGTQSVVGGQLEVISDGSASTVRSYQIITCLVGKTYLVSGYINPLGGITAQILVNINTNTGSPSGTTGIQASAGTYSFTFIATQTNMYVTLAPSTTTSGFGGAFDNISVKEASHGANIDGVQYFNTLNANTVIAGVVTEATGSALTSATTQFMEFDGVSGTYVSTPDSVANSIRQSITIEADCAADDWDLATFQTLNSKWGSGVSWLLVIIGGRLRLYIGNNSSQPSVNSSLLGFSDGTRHKVRAAYDALTQIVTFSEFVDGDWIVISSGAIAAPFIDDNSNPAQIGGWSSGINPFNGKIYSSTVTKGPTPYPYVLLDGVSGTYVSTPDSAANSVTGDLTLIAWAALDDWTPTSHVAIATKWRSAGDERSFMLRMAPDGKMQFNTTSDGSMATNLSSLSTVTTGFTDGTGHWVRLSLDISAGTVNFFTSDQPSDTPISSLSWVQLGGANVVHAQTAIFDGTATTQVGAYDNTVSRLSGKVSRAVIIASTDPTATPVVDFNPQPYLQGDTNFTSETGEVWTLQGNAIATSPIDDGVKVDCDAGDYVSGSTFVSSTSGETWTLNGNASVFQPPVDASGPFGYLAEGARTNILLQSNDLSTTWSNTSNSVDVQNYAIAPDGSSTGQRIIDSSVGGTGSVRMHQAIGSLSTTTQYVYSAFFKADQLGFVKMAASSFTIATPIAFFDLTNGLVGTGSNTDSAAIESVGNGWYRCWISFTTDASDIAGDINIYVADSVSNATVDLDGTSSILVWGAQLEAGSFPSSYIATAAAAVTRNADVLSSSLNEVYPLTVYVETVQSVDQSAGTSQSNIFSVNENTVHSQDEFFIRTKQSTVDYQGAVYSGSTVVVNITGGAPAVGVLRTLTMAVALNDVEVYVDGVSVGSDTSAALPAAPTLMNIGMTVYGGYQAYGTVRNVKLFDERLTDAEVADL